MRVTLLAHGASFDILSANNDPVGYETSGLRYSTLQGNEVSTSEQTLMTEHPLDNSALAPMRLHGELFVAATNGQPDGQIVVARVHRP